MACYAFDQNFMSQRPMQICKMDNSAYNPEDDIVLLESLSDLSCPSNLNEYNLSDDLSDLSPLPHSTDSVCAINPTQITNHVGQSTNPISAHDFPNRGYPNDNVCFSFGETNLDEVPMDLVSSEDEGAVTNDPNFTVVFSHVLEPNESSANSSDDQPTEQDEMELRGRALRSLLLQKHMSSNRSHPSQYQAVPITKPAPHILDSTKTAVRITRTAKVAQKFVIPVHIESSDDGDETFDGASVNLNHTESVASTAYVVTKNSDNDAGITTNTSDPKNCVGPPFVKKAKTLRLRLLIKRQQRIVEDRRKLSSQLSSTVLHLRTKLKHATALYKRSCSSLSKAQRALAAHRRELATAQRDCEIANSRSIAHTAFPSRIRKPSIQFKSTFSNGINVEQRKDLVTGAVSILRHARVQTLFMSIYSLDHLCRPAANSQVLSVQQTADQNKMDPERSHKTDNSIDPSIPLCPFLLDGECKDPSCVFQHPTSISNGPHQCENDHSQKATCINHTLVHSGQSSASASICEVCNLTLDSLSANAVEDPVVHKWHMFYVLFKKSTAKPKAALRKFFTHSSSLLDSISISVQLAEHHLFCILRAHSLQTLAEDVFNCMHLSGYPLSLCRTTMRYPFGYGARQQLGKDLLDRLLQVILTQSAHIDLHSSISDAFVYILYHMCKLFVERNHFTEVSTILDHFMTALPKHHSTLCGIWWLKLNITINQTLPLESSLFSFTNMPLFLRSSIVGNATLIRTIALDLDIPDGSIDVVSSLSTVQSVGINGICYLTLTCLYIQLLQLTNRCKDAYLFSLKISFLLAEHPYGDLFYLLSIYTFYQPKLARTDWSVISGDLADLTLPASLVSLRIEFSFLTAILSKDGASAGNILVETLGNLILLQSNEPQSQLSAFRTLLGLPCHPTQELNRLCYRGRTYLWLCYALFCLIHSLDLPLVLDQLVEFRRFHCNNQSDMICDHFVLHAIFTLANQVYIHDGVNYARILESVLLDRFVSIKKSFCLPSWLQELMQRINLFYLPSPGPRHDLCVRIVENYGIELIVSFCRRLFALGDRLLSQGLFAIGKVDKPDNEDFWLLYASLLASDSSAIGSSARQHQQIIHLSELFNDAILAVPSSLNLWKHYVLTIQASGVSTTGLIEQANIFDMHQAVLNFLNSNEEIKTQSISSKRLTNIEGRSRKVQLSSQPVTLSFKK